MSSQGIRENGDMVHFIASDWSHTKLLPNSIVDSFRPYARILNHHALTEFGFTHAEGHYTTIKTFATDPETRDAAREILGWIANKLRNTTGQPFSVYESDGDQYYAGVPASHRRPFVGIITATPAEIAAHL